jgi:YD repeat-containing protein
LQSVKAPDGEETRYHYDAAGRPLQLERAEGWQESIGWNSRGLPEYHITPDGKRHEFSWDDAGRLVATRNALGEEVRRRWDSRDRLTALQMKTGKRTTLSGGIRCCLLKQGWMVSQHSMNMMPADALCVVLSPPGIHRL